MVKSLTNKYQTKPKKETSYAVNSLSIYGYVVDEEELDKAIRNVSIEQVREEIEKMRDLTNTMSFIFRGTGA